MMDGLAWLTLLLGVLIGFTLALLFNRVRMHNARALAEELFRANQMQSSAQLQAIIDHLKNSFGALSLEALSRSTSEFIKLAQTRLASERQFTSQVLDEKKELIDQQLARMGGELEQIAALMNRLETDRAEKFGELARQLQLSGEQTHQLLQATTTLRDALAHTRVRGQWGERMAEDVLRMAGFIENINYSKQTTLSGSRTRPDFTFFLPRDLRLHMDVKFPLDNYLKYLEAGNDLERERYKSDFLRDVKLRIREITGRDYISPEDHTVDYVLLFIPNEQIYAFIQENDQALFEQGMKQHVIVCSPMTLFAVLAVVRQAVDNFALEQTSQEILRLLAAFKKQWEEFVKRMESLGKSLGAAQADYEALLTTRRRQLEVPLQKIEALRESHSMEKRAPNEHPQVD